MLLAAHADTVGVEREKWTVDPFAGLIRDGYVMGRGKYNTRWLSEEHWDKIDCEFALNEGGWIIKNPDGKVRYVSIATADKGGFTLVLTARGSSTHSSMPRPDNAISTLAKALARIADYDTRPFLIPNTREFFLTLAKTTNPPLSTYLSNLVMSSDPKVVAEADREISKDPLLHAIMRSTVAPVRMNAGFRGNVIPGSAEATINFRTIPGADHAELIEEIRKVINDPRVEMRTLSPPGFTPGQLARLRGIKPSSQDTELYRQLVAAAGEVYPGVPVTPYLFQAGTDAYAWRARGIPVYGIYPYAIDAEDLSRMHGNDERVGLTSLQEGTDLIYKTLLKVAGK